MTWYLKPCKRQLPRDSCKPACGLQRVSIICMPSVAYLGLQLQLLVLFLSTHVDSMTLPLQKDPDINRLRESSSDAVANKLPICPHARLLSLTCSCLAFLQLSSYLASPTSRVSGMSSCLHVLVCQDFPCCLIIRFSSRHLSVLPDWTQTYVCLLGTAGLAPRLSSLYVTSEVPLKSSQSLTSPAATVAKQVAGLVSHGIPAHCLMSIPKLNGLFVRDSSSKSPGAYGLRCTLGLANTLLASKHASQLAHPDLGGIMLHLNKAPSFSRSVVTGIIGQVSLSPGPPVTHGMAFAWSLQA